MLRLGIPLGLAVDGSASNDSSDMLGELRACLLLHRVLGGADALTAGDVLGIATRGGARLLGWGDEIGTLAPGKGADLVLIEMDRLDYAGALSDPLAAVIFSGISHAVDTAIVNGRVRLRGGQLVGIDERALRHDANRVARRMLEQAGHDARFVL
jgi:cytosine/adenosine deaminase-related metal-dependent hydrolase